MPFRSRFHWDRLFVIRISRYGTVLAAITRVLMEDDVMNEQGNDRTASGNGSASNGKVRTKLEHRQADYDVPIPRPSTDLGFHGIRRKRSGFDSHTRRRQDN